MDIKTKSKFHVIVRHNTNYEFFSDFTKHGWTSNIAFAKIYSLIEYAIKDLEKINTSKMEISIVEVIAEYQFSIDNERNKNTLRKMAEDKHISHEERRELVKSGLAVFKPSVYYGNDMILTEKGREIHNEFLREIWNN